MQAKQEAVVRQTRVLRIEIAPWTMIVLMLVIVGLWLFIRLLPVVLVLVVALMIVGTKTGLSKLTEATEMAGYPSSLKQ